MSLRSSLRAALLLGCSFGLAVALLPSCSLPDFEFGAGEGADAATDGAGGSSGTGGSATGGTGGTAGTGAATGGGGTPSGGTGGASCTGDADCATTPATPRCNTATGKCVACLPLGDNCTAGYYCAGTSCKAGCKSTSECTANLKCDETAHECLGCAKDDDCPAGKLCELSTTKCIAGCTATHACPSGEDCCNGACVLVFVLNPENCGSCGNKCPVPPAGTNAVADCQLGKCLLKCINVVGVQDCNKDASDGCEINTKTDADNCGQCLKKCAAGQTCSNGQCV